MNVNPSFRKEKHAVGLLSLLMLFWSCGSSSRQEQRDLLHIDVEGAMDNLSPLKLSDYFTSVEYVPLETDSNCLLGVRKRLFLTDSLLFVCYRAGRSVLAFDRATGRFVRNIGRVGDGPECCGICMGEMEYYVDEYHQKVYVWNWDDTYQAYSFEGDYLGKYVFHYGIDLNNRFHAANIAFSEGKTALYNNKREKGRPYVMVWDDVKDVCADSLLSPTDRYREGRTWAHNGSSMGYIPLIGGMNGGSEYYTDGTADFECPDRPTVYWYDDELRLKEPYADSIFAVRGGQRLPYAAFDMGKWAMTSGKEHLISETKDKFYLHVVYENSNIIYFVCQKNLYDEAVTTFEELLDNAYCGIYDKRTGQTHMMHGLGLEDDIMHVKPFEPMFMARDGALYGLAYPQDILSIENDNPSRELQRLQHLLKEDDNPVVVIAK